MIGPLLKLADRARRAAGHALVGEELGALRLRVAGLEGRAEHLESEFVDVRAIADEFHHGPGAVAERGRYG